MSRVDPMPCQMYSFGLFFAGAVLALSSLHRRRSSKRTPAPLIAKPSEKSSVTNSELQKPALQIYYCVKCKWLLRASWMATEYVMHRKRSMRQSPMIIESGTFRISASLNREDGETVIWDRRRDGGFPYPKDIKRLLRDGFMPTRALGKCLEGKK